MLHYHKACDNEMSTLEIHIFHFIGARIGDTEFDNEVSTWG